MGGDDKRHGGERCRPAYAKNSVHTSVTSLRENQNETNQNYTKEKMEKSKRQKTRTDVSRENDKRVYVKPMLVVRADAVA